MLGLKFDECRRALDDLLETLKPDLDLQRSYALPLLYKYRDDVSNPDHYLHQYSETRHVDIDDIIDRVENASSLEEIRVAVEYPLAAAYVPLYFLAPKFEVVTDVEFVHFTSEAAAKRIVREGFKGRLTPSKMTLTRSVQDFSDLNKGYIFAYESEYAKGSAVTIMQESQGIRGFATHALRFDFVPDEDEQQLIIPVACILDMEYADMKRYNPIPKEWGAGAPFKFTNQSSPNENLDGNIIRGADLSKSNLRGSSFRLTARKNPADTLVTNPNTGGVIWWYVTDEPNIEFRTGDDAHRFSWFGGDRQDWEDFGLFNLAMEKDYLLEVQIEIPAGCKVFDARTLFSDIPQWVRDSLRKSTQIDAEELESDEGYEFIENVRMMAIDRDTYMYFQNMRIEDPSLKALCSTFDSEGRTEFLIKLWLLDWSTVQAFLMDSPFAEESGRSIVGWYEIERVDYNYHTSINLGLYMGAPANSTSRKQGCSDIRVRVVNKISAEQRRRNPNSQTGSEGYTLTIEQEPYRTVLNWRLEGDDICARARIVFGKDNVESILESQVSGAVRDLAYAEDLSDGVLYGLQDEAIAYVTNDLEYETPVYLSKIEVLSEGDRGKGLGTDLMRELELYLQGEGIDTIYLQAVPSQRAAWYQRLGFEIIYPSSRDIQRGLVYPLLKKMLY